MLYCTPSACRCVATFLLALVLAVAAQAQGGRRTDILLYQRPILPLFVGIEGGYGQWTNEASFTVTDSKLPCALFTNGEGAGPVGGVKGMLYFNRWFFFSPRIRYETRSGTFLTPLPDEPVRDEANAIVQLSQEAQVDATMATFTFDPLVGIEIARTGLYLCGGPSASLLLDGSYDYTERIKSPSRFTYVATGTTEQGLVDGASFQQYQQFAFDLRGGAGFILRIGKFGLNPEVFYSFPLTSALASPDKLKQTGIVGTFSILYNLGE
ncbi:MAG: outer membrane beta-barrel protein [Candidatus Kapabacteria bacterium]|nr:outer membrane beta-barrel protein [Candidatus Kapabacteria bacterium]